MELRSEQLKNGIEFFYNKQYSFFTDSTLLARFAPIKKHSLMLELCSGCGYISFEIADKNLCKTITTVEIMKEAVELQQKTIKQNNLSNFIALNCDLKDYNGKHKQDCVVCNPPYFKIDSGFCSPKEVKATARHEVMCSFDDIAAAASRNLKTGGSFSFCMVPTRLNDVTESLHKYRLRIKRLALCRHSIGEKPWLMLIDARYERNCETEIVEDVIL